MARCGSFYQIIPLWAMQVVAIADVRLLAGGAGDGRAELLARRGADAKRLAPIAAGDRAMGRADAEEPGRRRQWVQRQLRGILDAPPLSAPRDVLWLHAVLRVHDERRSSTIRFLVGRRRIRFISVPVLLGTVGGVLMLIGTVGLFAMKFVDDPMPNVRRLLGADVALLMLLAMAALTGLVLLAVRATGAMGLAMAVHLGFILALFLVLPYSKMVHGVYRSAALLRRAVERNMKPLGGE